MKAFSLFSGAGGLDLGIHTAGFHVVGAVECDKDALSTLTLQEIKDWWGATTIFPEEIQGISNREIKRVCLQGGSGLNLLAGGPPCQPFSKSGYWRSGDSKRLNDPRADTLKEYFRVLEATLPDAFLLENVPGIAFREKSEGIQFIEDAVKGINNRNGTNYSVRAAKLNAAEHGVPQTRERVFVIGHVGGKKFRFPTATHHLPPKSNAADPASYLATKQADLSLECEQKLMPYATAWDAIGHLSGDDDPELQVRGKYRDLLFTIPEGCNYSFHTNRGGGEPLFGWRTRYWSMLLKLAKSRPSWTLTAQPGPAIGPFHWESRRLSSAELCAIQTLPESYVISGGVMSAHKQLGNAVPSALAELLALEIRRQFFEDHCEANPSLLPKRQLPVPPPEPVHPLPANWRDLASKDLRDHPGTGKGPGAIAAREEKRGQPAR